MHLIRPTERALRRLHNPLALAECELVAHLPNAVDTALTRLEVCTTGGITPRERAQALRAVLTEVLGRLKPVDHDQVRDSPGALQYTILWEEYVLGRPNRQIMHRLGISEGTFNRHRREAIVLVAHELAKEEQGRAQERSWPSDEVA